MIIFNRLETEQREYLQRRVRELEVENIAMANAIGNLRALLPDYDDNGVIEKISELERLRGAVKWAIETLNGKHEDGHIWWGRYFADELRRRAGMEGG